MNNSNKLEEKEKTIIDGEGQLKPGAKKPEKRTSLLKNPLIRRLLGQSLQQQWKRYSIAIVAMIVGAGTTSGTALILRDIVDTISNPEKQSLVLGVAAAVLAIFMIKGIASYIQTITLARAGLNITAQQQAIIYDKILRQGIAFFGESDSADIVVKVTRGAAASRAITEIIMTSYIKDVLTLIGLVSVMVYRQPALSTIALIMAPLAIIGLKKLMQESRKTAASELKASSEVVRVLQETSAGIRVIKAFSLEGALASRMVEAIGLVESRAYKFSKIQGITSPIMDTLSGLAIACIVIMSSMNFMGLGHTTSGELMSFLTALLMAYEPAKRLMRARLQIDRQLVALRQMFRIMDTPETTEELPDATPFPEGEGEISFDSVSFEFGKKRVIKNITQVFPARKLIALVGPSGSGKSTMFNLIMRMYDPLDGSVKIDGMDIRRATFKSLRSKISLVSQDTFLFSSSIRENIRAGRSSASDLEVEDAAKVANAHDFIMELPDGYNTLIGENGAFLSGGQRQRISIARAVVKKAPILLLDEATSALDSTSEKFVRDALHRITQSVTTVVIAHRFSTILNADLILYLEDGEIKESGTLNELLTLNGSFKKLYDEQFSHTKGEDN